MERPAVTRTRVKICGVTNREDAELAIALGADALGFNTFGGSKRFIDLLREGAWIAALPVFVTKVAVMVNPTLDEVRHTAALPFINLLQLHGHENEAFCAEVAKTGVPFMKAVAVRDQGSLAEAGRLATPHILLDAYSPTEFGGTGQQIDTALAARFVAAHPELHVSLSGGLTPDNVSAAIRAVGPYAVDVASGVERRDEPRRKDAGLLTRFFAAVRG